MTEPSPTRLGRGLSSLLPENTTSDTSTTDTRDARQLPVSSIEPSALQPRHIFDEEEMAALTKSVTEQGILQPILVRPMATKEPRWEIVAGERRWRAAQAARLHEIPVVIRTLTDQAALEIALVENLQRESLSPLEEAQGFQRLIDQFGHTQEAVAAALGKSRSHVANTLRLLTLPEPVRALLDSGKLTAGHARTLLGAADPERLARAIVARGLNVRQAERLAKKAAQALAAGDTASTPPAAARRLGKDADILVLERRVADALGLDVDILFDGQGGKLTVTYTSLDQLDELIDRLLKTPPRARETTDALPPPRPLANDR